MAAPAATTLQLEKQPDGLACLWLDTPNRPHNTLDRRTLTELDDAFETVATDPGIRLLIIASRKPSSFIVGADIQEFTKVTGPEDAMALSAVGQRLFDKLASLPVPTVAVVHGLCLGGGLELALACDYRGVLDAPAAQIGFPEIELGIIPAWGGTQRLPRVLGLERAFHVILQRRRLDSGAAMRWGMADFHAPNHQAALSEIKGKYKDAFITEGKRLKEGLPLRGWRQRLLEGTSASRWLLFRGVERVLRRRVPEDMPAPWEALEAIRTGVRHGLAAGLAREREAVGRLAQSAASRNLISLFFVIEQARKGSPDRKPALDGEATGRPIRKVGVIGAGIMGAGIAQLAAIKGFDVTVQEVNEAALAAGVKKIGALLDKAAARGVMSASDAKQMLARMGKTVSFEGFGDLDLVIEAAVEDLGIKRQLFRELEKRTRADAILATNTSSLSVRDLQQGSARPSRIAGLHFFNPVHKMPLVEVIQAPSTANDIAPLLASWAASLGKTPVVVRDSPGFLVNRILMPYLNEAGMLITEGMPIEHVDRIMRRFGMPMGPLELLDQVGLDVAAHVARAMRPVFGDRLHPGPALERMCAMGWLGQKNGKGFYVYRGKSKHVHAEALATLRSEFEPSTDGKKEKSPADQSVEARERMVCLMVNEAAMCLAEGLSDRPEVIDLAMVLGTGWAPHRGGPLRYADDRGAKEIVQVLDALAARLGTRFVPCAELRRRAETGAPFYDQLVFEAVG
jgi:3-hydroxyacyl-CoA dehydrogenase / enoyl-CoA hydratase / 3-hydroxybutyryl-CoA epimerase